MVDHVHREKMNVAGGISAKTKVRDKSFVINFIVVDANVSPMLGSMRCEESKRSA